jgi:hypothetical protein
VPLKFCKSVCFRPGDFHIDTQEDLHRLRSVFTSISHEVRWFLRTLKPRS